jgi:hypothetical protein
VSKPKSTKLHHRIKARIKKHVTRYVGR